MAKPLRTTFPLKVIESPEIVEISPLTTRTEKRTVLFMGIPKITKQTELRDNLYKTLEEVATDGITHLIPTKNGDVILISRQEYDAILLEKEYLQEFNSPINEDELMEVAEVFDRIDKKFGFKK